MKKDSKKYIKMPAELREKLYSRGYRQIEVEDEPFFDTFFEKMNGYWSSSTNVCNMICWQDTFPTFFKESDGMLLCLNYVCEEGRLYGIPMIGEYTDDGVRAAVATLKSDFESFGLNLVIMDVTNWMLPFFEKCGVEFDVVDDRDYMDYVYTNDMFLEGLNRKDDRYYYRLFVRRNEFEIEELTPGHIDEVRDFFESYWCATHECEDCHYGCLINVVSILTKAFDRMRLHGFIVRINGKMVGYSIVSVKKNYGIYQFKNAINNIRGLNEFILRETYDRYLTDVKEINYTEDVGIENLRYYKMHLAPEYRLSSKMVLTAKG